MSAVGGTGHGSGCVLVKPPSSLPVGGGSNTEALFSLFFFSPPGEKKQPKRELVARSDVEEISTLSTVLRDSLRSNKSSHRLRRRVQSPHFIANPFAIATLRAPPNLPEGEGT